MGKPPNYCSWAEAKGVTSAGGEIYNTIHRLKVITLNSHDILAYSVLRFQAAEKQLHTFTLPCYKSLH